LIYDEINLYIYVLINTIPNLPIMPVLVPNRICIYAKDIQNITGKKERTARKLLSDIRQSLGKQKNELVTVEDFCRHTGLKEEQVSRFLTL
jgi:hypothetical protein